MKKIYRSRENRIVFGICGGIGEYYNIDPAITRIIFIILLFVTGLLPLILAYLISYFIIPDNRMNN